MDRLLAIHCVLHLREYRATLGIILSQWPEQQEVGNLLPEPTQLFLCCAVGLNDSEGILPEIEPGVLQERGTAVSQSPRTSYFVSVLRMNFSPAKVVRSRLR